MQSFFAQLRNMAHNSSLHPGELQRFSTETVP